MGGNFDIFDAFQLDRQNLTCQNNTAFIGVWWKTVTIRQYIFRQIFEESVSIKISPIKILHYTVVAKILDSTVRLKNSQSELFSMIEQLENSRQEKNKYLQVSYVNI